MFLRAKKLSQFIPENIKIFCSKFQENNFDCYIVGGAIRDILLGKTPQEYDFTTNAKPEQIEQIFSETIPTGKKYGTISVKYENQLYEVTTFRQESNYQDGRHPEEIVFTEDIRQDLGRRDFTINAIAFCPIKNDLVDSFQGLEDLHHKILRTVGNPEQRFTEDGLRVWRAMRFLAQLNFALDFDTGRALAKFTQAPFNLAAKERIMLELQKLLKSANPEYGLSFLDNLPSINKYNAADVRLAALCQQFPQINQLVVEKQLRKRIDDLIKYNLDESKANFTIKDLNINGIDLMELGLRGQQIGDLLDKIKDLVLEFRRINKKERLIKLAKELICGLDEDTVKEKIKAGLYN